MRVARFTLLIAWLLPLLLTGTAIAAPNEPGAPPTAYIEGGKASVVAFLPPSLEDNRESHAGQARELVRSAIRDARLCLGEAAVSFRVVFAQRIVVRLPNGDETFELGNAGLVGALLLRPGANARILFAGGGPEAMSRLLVPAAGEYFGKVCQNG